MIQSFPSSIPTVARAQEPWSVVLGSNLAPKKTIRAGLQLDLDARLHFTHGWLVVTNRHLIGQAPGGKDSQSWDIAPGTTSAHSDYAGVGTLGLPDGQHRSVSWRYTLGHNTDTLRLADAFDAQRDALTIGAKAAQPDAGTYPICKAPLPTGDDNCPQCGRELEQSPSIWALLRLWCFAQPYRWEPLAGLALLLIGTVATLMPPHLTTPLMDKALIPYRNGQPVDYCLVTLYLSGLFGVALVAWVLGWARTCLLARVSERVSADLRTTTYEHPFKLSFEYFDGKRADDLMACIGSESDRISVFLLLHLLDLATDVLMITMTAVILVSIDPWLALVTLVPLSFIAWMVHLVRGRLYHGFERIDWVRPEITNVLADTILGICVVKTFAQEKREVTRFAGVNKHNLAINDHVNAVWLLFTPTVTLLTEVGLLVVWIFGIWWVSHDAVTVSVLVASPTYINRFYARLDSVSRIASVTQKVVAGAKRVFDILGHVSSASEPARPVHLEKVRGAIELCDPDFRYGNRAVIRSLDLSIQPGEMIGPVGHSGSGKSTFVNLTCRFYDIFEGVIRLDGTDVRSLPVLEFRHNIDLVLQESFLFFGTIADNIVYGKPDATREEIIAAACAAHAHKFILRLPYDYDSLVGERGQILSDGECQRTSIARALLINPRILIMDEATSSVDTTTEKEIQKALDDLVQDRTTIAIAHRLLILRKVGRLVVMDRGQIAEVGNYDELFAREGAYYKFYQVQARSVDAEIDLTSDGERVDAAAPAYAQ